MGKKGFLAPGFRFHPTDVELVRYYLRRKVMGKKLLVDAIMELDIYRFNPWDLTQKSHLRTGELKWYFFCPKEKKYATGARMKRATEFGYWKTTGKDRSVTYKGEVAGMIKTLVFHAGKAPKGERTDWVMYEYRLEEEGLAEQDAFVLCVIFKKDGPGPKNGAQYGVPFNEEDWDDDEAEEEEDMNVQGAVSLGAIAIAASVLQSMTTSPSPPSVVLEPASADFHCTDVQPPTTEALLCKFACGDAYAPFSVVSSDTIAPCPDAYGYFPVVSGAVAPCSDVYGPSPTLCDAVAPCLEVPMANDDDICALLASFLDDKDKNEDVACPNTCGADPFNIYDGLGDLSSSGQFLELKDLDAPLDWSWQ